MHLNQQRIGEDGARPEAAISRQRAQQAAHDDGAQRVGQACVPCAVRVKADPERTADRREQRAGGIAKTRMHPTPREHQRRDEDESEADLYRLERTAEKRRRQQVVERRWHRVGSEKRRTRARESLSGDDVARDGDVPDLVDAVDGHAMIGDVEDRVENQEAESEEDAGTRCARLGRALCEQRRQMELSLEKRDRTLNVFARQSAVARGRACRQACW
jgi:hypothetical protein